MMSVCVPGLRELKKVMLDPAIWLSKRRAGNLLLPQRVAKGTRRNPVLFSDAGIIVLEVYL